MSSSLVWFLGRLRAIWVVFGSSSFPSIYSFPRLGIKTNGSRRTESLKEKGHKFAPKAPITSKFHVRRSRMRPLLLICLLHSSHLYPEKELRAAKLCKHLLREPLNEALFTTHFTQTIGISPSNLRLVIMGTMVTKLL